MMTAIFLAILVYAGLFIWLSIRWQTVPNNHQINMSLPVTVMIPVRNEAGTIEKLLEAIDEQDFGMEMLEVIVIDDHSEDATVKKVREFAKHARYRLKCLALPKDQSGKKMAATYGVSHASNELILCTDGDTIPATSWVKTMTGPIASAGCEMVSGPVKIHSYDSLERMQAIEFSGLIGFGAITLDASLPTMCNGANMAYRKGAFLAVDGYNDNLHIPSGDDEFLMRKLHQAFEGKVAFAKSQEASVTTAAKPTMAELWNQRVRWIGKWHHHKSFFVGLLAIISYLVFLLMGILPWWLLAYSLKIGSLALLIKFGGEMVYLKRVANFLQIDWNWRDAFLLSLIYPVYVVFLGIASIFGRYSWKGRRY